ncbi:MAG TPA: NERD domain-containing protein [Deltaproteobacteria bacterium]|nr:NERD domain-containing protein [Deltaproteobacteria bacterium]
MALNWIEDIVSQFCKNRGYLVHENRDLPMPKTKVRTICGHSDIDVPAIGNDEIFHIECQNWWGPSRSEEEKEHNRLLNRFKNSPKLLEEKHSFLLRGKAIKRILVTTGKPAKPGQKGGQ